ncbi:MAG: fibronectin type III domain-containing protein [Chloroflexi bacterium]|nr:fibronectin type III domain-containing protein [Chloroflexota bacterium]
MLRRLPRLQTMLLGCAVLVGLAAWFWWTPPGAAAQDGLPTQVAVLTITGLHQGLRVYWYEPNEDGGSPLTGYDVQYRASGVQAWTNAGHSGLSQPAVIAGLRFNTICEVRVRARNANGAGPWSTTESRRTLTNDGRPDPPWPPTLEPGDGRIEVSWTAPTDTGSSAITGYRLRYSTDDAATWRSGTPGGNRLIRSTRTTISGLDNGTIVGVAVAAVNGRFSSPIAAAAPVQALALNLETTGKLCTANTSTELHWTITGGIPPFKLTIAGNQIDPDAESHRVNCGPLLIGRYAEEEGRQLPNVFESCIYNSVNINDDSQAALDESGRYLDAYYTTTYTVEALSLCVATGTQISGSPMSRDTSTPGQRRSC